MSPSPSSVLPVRGAAIAKRSPPRPLAWGARLGGAVRAAGRRQRPQTVLLSPQGLLSWPAGPVDGPVQHIDFGAWCASAAGEAASVIVSAHAIHSLAYSPEPGADPRSHADAARRAFVHYHGRESERWALAVDAGRGDVFASALHGFDLAAMLATAAAHGVKLRRVVPLWSVALRAAAAREPALCAADRATLAIVEGAIVTCLDLDRGELADLQQRHLDDARVDDFAEMLSRRRGEGDGPDRRVFAAGWGLGGSGDAANGWHALGTLAGTAADSGWLVDPETGGMA